MTIRRQIEASSASLAHSERKLATALLSDYPSARHGFIQGLAERAEVSPPSILRFVAKTGLGGYSDLQKRMLTEFREGERSPMDLHAAAKQIDGGSLSGFPGRAAEQMASASDAIAEDQFDRICDLPNNRKRKVYAAGGRISDTVALILSFHLRQSREDVFHVPRDPDVWPDDLLRMRQGDVFFQVDFRRSQKTLVPLAAQAHARRTQVILMTD
ncbi:MAG: MurR/RpiR family transcriptional regulator [Pseudomonadota bacterium]